ncbi:hypothetical protein BCR37DRAFT_383414 [Protomyces lactucae-debilis]|uniref:Threonine/serine exporter-like N-terminal domain-containing protein n=1 Tax=Protomyces lactucae-debilis TaxID=2754530 RepID=A0A1Y2EXM6_PROLT|nr:uncharacterized protein BCR37DRAFT_383414 [Protomyces lactucae-debilis]ORY76328.1 hypothetical protein BCR37DRAFT_383414 [Protomyces lactucae-debilis]
MSAGPSREGSTTDLSTAGGAKNTRKNVHFDGPRGTEDAAGAVMTQTEGSPSKDASTPTGRKGALKQPYSNESINAALAKSLGQAAPISNKGLFFLQEESEDDEVDSAGKGKVTPKAPFKKTGIKMGLSRSAPVSPVLRPQADEMATMQDVDLDAPKTPSNGSSRVRLADRRQGGPDMPRIDLPDAGTSDRQTPGAYSLYSTPGAGDNTMMGSSYFKNKSDADLLGDKEQVFLMSDLSRPTSAPPTEPTETTAPAASATAEDEAHRKLNLEAYKLVRAHTILAKRDEPGPSSRRSSFQSTNNSGTTTPYDIEEGYIPAPKRVRGGVLSNLMQLYNSTVYQQPTGSRDPGKSALPSGAQTPKWHQKHSQSQTSIAALLGAGHALGSLAANQHLPLAHSRNGSMTSLPDAVSDAAHAVRPPTPKRKHSGGLAFAVKSHLGNTRGHAARLDAELRVTMAIADVLHRQQFVVKLCKALMLFGAPTHRLEAYLKMTARALEIDAQFLYIPGCMVVAFEDRATHTSDVKIIRVDQGIDIGKLERVHLVYKNVVHGIVDVEHGIAQLDTQMECPQLYKLGFVLFAYGLAAVCVGPFGFGSSFIDLPIQFLLGLIVGVLQMVVAPRSPLYANVFEILATVVVSFLGRGFGSIPKPGHPGETLFCFAALAQSSIALILPGYMVLCGALELQSKSIVAGSTRLFYAIVYSLFLSFGVTIGSVLYGWFDSGATTSTTCSSNISPWWRFLFVPGFTLCLLIVNQARPKQMPIAIFIAGIGYLTNYFTLQKFGAAQVSNALAAFAIGTLGNLYSRIGHGLSFTAVLPSIFVQVPSGLASSSSLVSGLELANSILNNTANSTYGGDTIGASGAGALQFGYAMIQIAVGLCVGLAASALVVYVPVCWGNNKRTGMMTF